MTDAEVDIVLNSLDTLWPSNRERLSPEVRAMWGGMLKRHDYRAVQGAVVQLLGTSKWRPQLAEILELARPRANRQRSLASNRKALAAPEVHPLPPEKIQEVLASATEAVRPTAMKSRPEREFRSATGMTAIRRKWGAVALEVLAERLGEGDEFAADVLDEVARRAR